MAGGVHRPGCLLRNRASVRWHASIFFQRRIGNERPQILPKLHQRKDGYCHHDDICPFSYPLYPTYREVTT